MISKTRLKELSAFKLAKRCEEAGVFVVEGVKMAEEALHSGWSIVTVCATSVWWSTHLDLFSQYESYEVSESELERLSGMRTPSAVWMLMMRDGDIPAGQPSSKLTLVLDHLQDPGNMGTIIRTADWFGVRQIVCSRDTVSCYNPKVVQSTMGSLFRVGVHYTDLIQWLKECQEPIYGAVLGGDDLFKSAFDLPAALVIGNESRGISQEVRAMLTRPVEIPNRGGTAESLNASVAAAILLAEVTRG